MQARTLRRSCDKLDVYRHERVQRLRVLDSQRFHKLGHGAYCAAAVFVVHR